MSDETSRLEKATAYAVDILDRCRREIEASAIQIGSGPRAKTLGSMATCARLTGEELVHAWRAVHGRAPRTIILVGEGIADARTDEASGNDPATWLSARSRLGRALGEDPNTPWEALIGEVTMMRIAAMRRVGSTVGEICEATGWIRDDVEKVIAHRLGAGYVGKRAALADDDSVGTVITVVGPVSASRLAEDVRSALGRDGSVTVEMVDGGEVTADPHAWTVIGQRLVDLRDESKSCAHGEHGDELWKSMHASSYRTIERVMEIIRDELSLGDDWTTPPRDDLATLRAATQVYIPDADLSGDIDEAHAVLARLTEDHTIRDERDRLREAVARTLGREGPEATDVDGMIAALPGDIGEMTMEMARLREAVATTGRIVARAVAGRLAKDWDDAIDEVATLLGVDAINPEPMVREIRELKSDADYNRAANDGPHMVAVGEVAEALGLGSIVDRLSLMARLRDLRESFDGAVRSARELVGAAEISKGREG